MNLKDVVVTLDTQSKNALIGMVRLFAGKELKDCTKTESSKYLGLGEVKGSSVDNKELEYTDALILDALIIQFTENKSDLVSLSTSEGTNFARMLGFSNVTNEDYNTVLSEVCKELGIGKSESNPDDPDDPGFWKDPDDDPDDPDDPDGGGWGEPDDDPEGNPGGDPEGEPEGDPKEEPKEEPKKETPEPVEKESEVDKKIKGFYSDIINGAISKILHRYTGLFESGYEIEKPAGVLTSKGLLGLSGSSIKEVRCDATSYNIYSNICSKMKFVESESRSNINIAKDILSGYSGNKLLYFPYKMLEYVYGRKAPSGDNQDSLNTYTLHSDASSFKKYLKTEMSVSVQNVVEVCFVQFMRFMLKDSECSLENLNNNIESATKFLDYVKDCLTTCILFVTLKESTGGFRDRFITEFKIRVCDFTGSLKPYSTFVDYIIDTSFSGSPGSDPYTTVHEFNDGSDVVDFDHEFDRKRSQGVPLFAYQSYRMLRAQAEVNGESTEGIISFNNIVLGKDERGRIFKSGPESKIDINKNLVHHIYAGSRAGKGVMTLNILAAAVASGKAIFYLDAKPDMASVFHGICQDMFIVNGRFENSSYDDGGFYSDGVNSRLDKSYEHIPKVALDALGISDSGRDSDRLWYYSDGGKLSTVFYLRALMLAVGIIEARAMVTRISGSPDVNGQNGVVLVVDEVSNVQQTLHEVIAHALSLLPPTVYNACKMDLKTEMTREKPNPIKLMEAKEPFDTSFTVKGFYALSWLNSIADSLEYIETKSRAGFDPLEAERSNIFLLGQTANYKQTGGSELKSILSRSGSCRYAIKGATGLKNEGKKIFKISGSSSTSNESESLSSPVKSFVELKVNSSDVFIGNNDQGYLRNKDENSKAYGKLDEVANNFAYLGVGYSESLRHSLMLSNRQNTTENNVHYNLAKGATYFKPFLILNANTATYVDQMRSRVEKAGVPFDQLADENCPQEDEPNVPGEGGTGFTNAIGFKGYLTQIGVEDIYNTLKVSGDIANYVVNLMGYSGDWFDFVTDLNPDWIFTVEDVVNALMGNTSTGLYNKESSSVFSEYIQYCRDMGIDFLGNRIEGAPSILEGFDDEKASGKNEGELTKSDEELKKLLEGASQRQKQEMLKKLNGGSGTGSSESGSGVGGSGSPSGGQVSIVDDPEPVAPKEPVGGSTGSGEGQKEKEFSLFGPDDPEPDPDDPEGGKGNPVVGANGASKENIDEIVEYLKSLGFTVNTPSDYTKKEESKESKFSFKGMMTKKLSETPKFNEGESLKSLENVVSLISKDIIDAYGGLDAVKSFKVRSGCVVINDQIFRVKIPRSALDTLPYDLVMEITGGNVSKLFDYRKLYAFKSLRELGFDSASFVYDYVSPSMGYGSRVSVDLFFRDITSLDTLIIGDKVYHRSDYKEKIKDDDIFYNPRFFKRVADFSENTIDAMFKASWSFTKNQARNKQYGLLRKSLGVATGTAVTAASGIADVGVKAVRHGLDSLRRLSNSIKEARDFYGKDE